MSGENKKLKLCFLATLKDIHSQRWIKYFADKNYEIHWISLTSGYSEYINEIKNRNVKIYFLRDFKLKPLNILFNILPIRRLIKRINPSLLHIHCAGVNGILGALSGFHPFVLTAHGSDILIAPKSAVVRPLIKFTLKKADLITCDGENVRDAIINFGINPNRIKTIYFGVDTKKFSPMEKDKNLMDKLNALNSPLIISLRSLDPLYDIETLIKASPFVLKDFPSAKFIIAGKGPQEKFLKILSRNLGTSKSIRFVGLIPHSDLPRYLKSADVYISTSLSDGGISVSTTEAMACGLPVVITDFGDNRKCIEDNKNGFVVPVKNWKLLAEKIIYLLKNKEIRDKFGKINRQIIEEKYDYYKEMEKVENIYKDFKNKNLRALLAEP